VNNFIARLNTASVGYFVLPILVVA